MNISKLEDNVKGGIYQNLQVQLVNSGGVFVPTALGE